MNNQEFSAAALFAIRHSGHLWKSNQVGPNGFRIWPIEEYLARTNHGQNVRDRIRRLNADGKEEGAIPRGWHPHARSVCFLRDVVGIKEFNKRYGPGAHRKLPKEAFVKTGGKRRAITRMAIMEYRA